MSLFEMIFLAQVGLGILLVHYLLRQDTGPKEPKKALILATVLGAAAIPVAIYLEDIFVPDTVFTDRYLLDWGELLHAALLIALIEESAKALFLSLYVHKRSFFNEMTDGVIYFAIAGMAFGVLENVAYTLSYGEFVGLGRILVTPFIHAAFSAAFGWTLALWRVRRWPGMIVGVGAAVAVGLHALYDFGLLYARWWSVLAALVMAGLLNFGLFWLMRRGKRLDIQAGIASDGKNFFCRACGAPNPDRFLYCTRCGKRT